MERRPSRTRQWRTCLLRPWPSPQSQPEPIFLRLLASLREHLMPHAKIATKQAKFTLEQLHAELGGKILDNKAEHSRLSESMKHVEAVLKLLDPSYSVRGISVRRRKPNPWFKRGTVFRSALDVLRV